MTDFAQRGALKPIDFATDKIKEGFSQSWLDLGTVDGKLYGLFFKGANKSTIWYNVPVFEDAGVEPAENWDDFLAAGDTIAESGVPPYSIGGADGWTLTDLFENIYLRTRRPGEVRPADEARDSLDRPVGDRRADGDGQAAPVGQDRRRHLERAPDRLPDLGDAGLRRSAEGGAGARGRLRRHQHRHRDQGAAGNRLQRLRLPRDQRLGPDGDGRRRRDGDVQGQPGRTRPDRVSRDARGG